MDEWLCRYPLKVEIAGSNPARSTNIGVIMAVEITAFKTGDGKVFEIPDQASEQAKAALKIVAEAHEHKYALLTMYYANPIVEFNGSKNWEKIYNWLTSNRENILSQMYKVHDISLDIDISSLEI